MDDKEYLKYIPLFLADHTHNAILLTFIPGILYVCAAYGQLLLKGSSLTMSIVVSIFFAALEYIVRVPIIKYSKAEAGMTNGMMQFVWISVTMLLSWVSEGLK